MKQLFLLALTCTFLVQCQKKSEPTDDAPKSNPVSFAGSAHENACSWDASGKPDCLVAPDVISQSLYDFINANLPEGRDLRYKDSPLLSGNAQADLTISEASDVYITFVYQNTVSNNTFGFYTFPTGQGPKTASDIKTITYVFPNAKSPSPLYPGDKVKIGRFAAGTSIGFVLLQNGWSNQLRKPDSAALHFCSTDVLNPEIDPSLKKHTVLLNYAAENKLLIAFEDADRTTLSCDHDFNDVVFYATVLH